MVQDEALSPRLPERWQAPGSAHALHGQGRALSSVQSSGLLITRSAAVAIMLGARYDSAPFPRRGFLVRCRRVIALGFGYLDPGDEIEPNLWVFNF